MVITYFTMGPWNVPGPQHSRIGACIQASGPSLTAGTSRLPWDPKDCGTKITDLGAPFATLATVGKVQSRSWSFSSTGREAPTACMA